MVERAIKLYPLLMVFARVYRANNNFPMLYWLSFICVCRKRALNLKTMGDNIAVINFQVDSIPLTPEGTHQSGFIVNKSRCIIYTHQSGNATYRFKFCKSFEKNHEINEVTVLYYWFTYFIYRFIRKQDLKKLNLEMFYVNDKVVPSKANHEILHVLFSTVVIVMKNGRRNTAVMREEKLHSISDCDSF